MKASTYFLSKATATKIGIDAYQETHHPLSPEELEALRDLDISAQEWEDYAKTLEGKHCSTVLEYLQEYENANVFKKANVILSGKDDRTICKFRGDIHVLIRTLSFYIASMPACFCVEYADRGIVSIYVELEEEE